MAKNIQDSGNDELPEGLTLEKAKEIRDYAQTETQKILAQVQAQGGNQQNFQEKFLFEVSKLDDIIFIKYGFRNTEVLKSFHKFNLVPGQKSNMKM